MATEPEFRLGPAWPCLPSTLVNLPNSLSFKVVNHRRRRNVYCFASKNLLPKSTNKFLFYIGTLFSLDVASQVHFDLAM